MITQAILKALRKKIGCASIGDPVVFGKNVLNQCFQYETDKGRFFVKVSSSGDIDAIAAEAKALEMIDESGTLRSPRPQYFGYYENQVFLIMEYLELLPHTPESIELLGRNLALMHQQKTHEVFGFPLDNLLGATVQPNSFNNSWTAFFVEKRLRYQLKINEDKYGDKELRSLGEKAVESVETILSKIEATACLLHGDLWSGNTARDTEGMPVVFDPASYYGHSEADLSITTMFGGFPPRFYEAYHEIIPKESGFEERQRIYRLYHTLNHYYQFGDSYRGECINLIKAIHA
ncbi:fructosamine kinase family protein [Estrella lausannensis]|uniref:Fructosamine kinase family protein n=1 Tax=Estrella lausannensis TaxID=483423 RepID=A0A0H5E2G1_9BACT|nr:fructosamine kinase family protein [Estrella lausannensis]CRX37375.1 Fructosamine kinase family protein [Estrella lausannensis]